MNVDNILDMALTARFHAYAPYSKFKVGCAILLKNGQYVLGCNIENKSLGLSICAERNAAFKLISEGKTKNDVEAICIVADTKSPTSPCGACREVLMELLAPNTKVILANLNRDYIELTLDELLPHAFVLNED